METRWEDGGWGKLSDTNEKWLQEQTLVIKGSTVHVLISAFTCRSGPSGRSLLDWLGLLLQTMAHMKVVEFQGDPKANSPASPPLSLLPVTDPDLTPSPDVPLAILKRKMMASNDLEVSRGLLMDINKHLKVETAESSWTVAAPGLWLSAWLCLRSDQGPAGWHHVPGGPESDQRQAEDGTSSERTRWADPARVLPVRRQPLQTQVLQLAQTGGKSANWHHKQADESWPWPSSEFQDWRWGAHQRDWSCFGRVRENSPFPVTSLLTVRKGNHGFGSQHVIMCCHLHRRD